MRTKLSIRIRRLGIDRVLDGLIVALHGDVGLAGAGLVAFAAGWEVVAGVVGGHFFVILVVEGFWGMGNGLG